MSGESRWTAVTALADGSRRTLYEYVRRQDHPVSREEAAEATGMSRNLAAFHLDKLVDAGCSPRGSRRRTGGGAGRRRCTRPRRTGSRSRSRSGGTSWSRRSSPTRSPTTRWTPARPRRDHARRRGEAFAAGLGGVGLDEVLAGFGFEPERPDGATVVLRNCPFHALAVRQTALVCGLNHAFLAGLVDGLGLAGGTDARLAPRAGACCVELVTRP